MNKPVFDMLFKNYFKIILGRLIGICPANARSNIECPIMPSQHACTSDSDCLSGKKCCMYGCGKQCITPRYNSPIYL